LRERGKDGEGEEGKPTQASNSKTAYANGTSLFPTLISTFQAERLSLFGHIARMDNSDATRILAAFALEDWRR